MPDREIIFHDLNDPILLFGEHDQNIRLLEKEFFVTIFPKGNGIRIQGDNENIDLAEKTLNYLFHESKRGHSIKNNDLQIVVHQIKEDDNFHFEGITTQKIIFKSGKIVKPKTTNQAQYIRAMQNHDLVFGIGPAGTGKTYLAVALGLQALLLDKVQRLILIRPVVEAGENLGFLPGDLQQKVNPYLRPVFDAIHDMISYEDFVKLREKERIEIAPLAYMRGRTLNNAFTILDEAQNTTKSQLKMFLTRLGPTSKTVVTGDLTQIDLPQKNNSGLVLASKILTHISEIKFVHFANRDIVRHHIVRKIVKAFEKYEDEHDPKL
ncbi:MAG: PhoH family protein [Spirochaetota bacterium]|nr:PhoH family protein [Spirochaetota bacterium]